MRKNKILLLCMISAYGLMFSGCGQPVEDASQVSEKKCGDCDAS